MGPLKEIHRKLVGVVEGLSRAAMTPGVVKMIHGVAFHDIYHAGQIKLLRRLIEDRKN